MIDHETQFPAAESGRPARRRASSQKSSWLALLTAFAFSYATSPALGAKIVDSKHNLSASGPGEVRALSEERVCVFCHTPHAARQDAPLWNRRGSTAAYAPYDSPTLKAQPGQPTGASKLCLSCHDGTIALGDLVGEDTPIATSAGGGMPAGAGLIGTDLRDDHPISFDYNAALAQAPGKLALPSAWDPRVQLDANSDLQCTTCHEPHDNQWGNFLVMENQGSRLCRQCHLLDAFDATPHSASGLTWNGSGPDPWPHTQYADVQANACLNCHTPHHAEGPAELLTSSLEEDVCFVCHNGNVAPFDLQAVFLKPYAHPVGQTQGAHQAGENALDAGGHVECVDCHNPHRARTAPAVAPFVKGVLEGVSGIDAAGSPVAEARYEYEICFKCHADRAEQPLDAIARRIPSLNTRKEFSPSSPSFHPVETAGANQDVPSLIPPLTESSIIYCSDCHNNDGAQSPVSGSSGPHGSSHPFLLARRYRTGDNIVESPDAYALCYGCHNRNSILGNASFPRHAVYIIEKRISCSVCHDAHGIDFGQGNPLNNAHLINFDAALVQPDPQTGRLEYRSDTPRTGSCALRCHSTDHSPKTY